MARSLTTAMSAHSDLQAAALTQPADGGHHRLGRLTQWCRTASHPCPARSRTSASCPRRHRPCRRPGEDVTGAGDQQPGQVRVGTDMVDRVLDAEKHRRCHRVARLGGLSRQTPNAPSRVNQERGAQPVTVGRAGSVAGTHRLHTIAGDCAIRLAAQNVVDGLGGRRSHPRRAPGRLRASAAAARPQRPSAPRRPSGRPARMANVAGAGGVDRLPPPVPARRSRRRRPDSTPRGRRG